jgi:hypothetical protein
MAFRAEAFSSTTALKIQQYNRIAGFYTQKSISISYQTRDCHGVPLDCNGH